MSLSCTPPDQQPSATETSANGERLTFSSYLQRAEEHAIPASVFAPRMSEEFDINQFLCFSHDDEQGKEPLSMPEKDFFTQELMREINLTRMKSPSLEDLQLIKQESTDDVQQSQQQAQLLLQTQPFPDFSSSQPIDQLALLNFMRQQQQLQQQAQNIQQQQQFLSQQQPLYQAFMPWIPDTTTQSQQMPFYFSPQNLNVGSQKGMYGQSINAQGEQTTPIDILFSATPLSSLSSLVQPGFMVPPFFPGFIPQATLDASASAAFPGQFYPYPKGTSSYSVPNTPSNGSPPVTHQRRNSLSNGTFPTACSQNAGHRKTKSESSVITSFMDDFMMRDNVHTEEESSDDVIRPPASPSAYLSSMSKSLMTSHQQGLMCGVDSSTASLFASGMPIITSAGVHSICKIPDCLVCNRPLPDILRVNAPSWSAILRVVFYTLKINFPEKEFFNLRNHVYDFVETHWQKICIGKTKSEHWRKQLQDTLAHNKKLFVSGADVYKQKGFWKLEELTDPWEEKNATTLLAEKHEREARFKERSAKRLRTNPIDMGSAAM